MWKLRHYDKEKKKKLFELGHHKLISHLLSQKNIEPENANKFIKKDYNDLSDPHALNSIKEASQLFCDVALKKGSVGICGDYDADGIISTTMLFELCNSFHLPRKIFLPDRIEHGYGLNPKSIVSIKKKFVTPPDLLLITDCGSNNEKEIQELKQWGVKHTIILDHHIVDPEKISKSSDVLINWHLQDNFEETCACGEVYHFIRGIRKLTRKVDPKEFLTYAAIGILADVSPIIGDNRIIVSNGLKDSFINHITASGVIALIKASRIFSKSLNQEDVLFKLAPRINAAGRMASPDIAFDLMIENELSEAEKLAGNLSEYNDKRKKEQKKIEKEAIDMVKMNPEKYEHGILLYNSEWKTGIVGIVASRIVETFHKPALIIGRSGDIFKGSGRTLYPINLKEVLDLCKDLFISFGGHSMAAGVTIRPDYMDKANKIFNIACEQYYSTHEKPIDCSYYDGAFPPKEVNYKNARLLLDTIYPYCSQYNPEPVFLLRDVIISDVQTASSKDRKDSKTEWSSLSFVAKKGEEITPLRLRIFSPEFGKEVEGKTADVYFSLPQTISPSTAKYPSQANVIDIVFKK